MGEGGFISLGEGGLAMIRRDIIQIHFLVAMSFQNLITSSCGANI